MRRKIHIKISNRHSKNGSYNRQFLNFAALVKYSVKNNSQMKQQMLMLVVYARYLKRRMLMTRHRYASH